MDKVKTVTWLVIILMVVVVVTLVITLTTKEQIVTNADGTSTVKKFPLGIGAAKAASANTNTAVI